MVFLSILLVVGTIYGVLMEVEEDLKYDLVYDGKINISEFKKEHFYDYDIIDIGELEKWGIDIKDLKLEKSDMLCYSTGYEFTRIWHYKYSPKLF